MSHQAIAAVLAVHDLSSGERLVAFSLASFADRENRARPGTPAAAERAGLRRSWFLEARDMLVRRGLVVVEQAATGRGRASTLWLPFAETGPWWDGEINAELLETVLSYSRSQGTARLLLAAMAALADEQRVVEGVTTERLCAAAGVTDSDVPPGPGRVALLGRAGPAWRNGRQGQYELLGDRGPEIAHCRGPAAEPAAGRAAFRAAAVARERDRSAGGRAARQRGHRSGVSRSRAANGGPDRTVSGQNRPVTAGVSRRKGGAGRTLSQPEPSGQRRGFRPKGRR